MTEPAIAITLAISVVSSALLFIWTRGSDQFFRPLVPGVLVTSAGLLIAIAMYLWLFDRSRCEPNDSFACTVNANQGLLTGLGLVIAAAAIWTGAISNAAARRRTENEEIARTASIVAAAVAELNHNLIHVACAYEGNTLTELPQVTTESTRLLLESPNRERLAPEVIEQVEPLRRNDELLDDLRSKIRLDKEGSPEAADPDPLGGLVRCTFGAIFELWLHHPQWCGETITRPELQDIERIAAHNGGFFSFRSSDAQEDAPVLRTKRTALICWIDDQPVSGVTTYALMPRYRDAALAHQPHP
jgi:hypothetical protein